MINVFFYGNCQVEAVEKTLRLDPEICSARVVNCWLTEMTKADFTDLIAKADIVVTQPIADGYRGLDYLSTSYILHHRKEGSQVFLFDSCHFTFYYFDVRYRQWNGAPLNKPISYHYDTLVDCYMNHATVDDWLESCVLNPDLKTSEQLEEIATGSLDRLRNRYSENLGKYDGPRVHILSIHDFIRDNYKEKLLFYSMNHPSSLVIQFVCEEFLRFTGLPNTMDYAIDVLAMIRCVLYSCVQKNVAFSIADHEPLLLGKTTAGDIARLYYDAYARIGLS